MNYIFKSAFSGAFLLAAMAVNAQDLARKIPADAIAVATIKGKNLTELMSVTEFNNSFIGKEILSKLSQKGHGTYNSVEDFGFNLSANFYYYNQTNDSVSYNCLLSPIKDATKLDQLLISSDKRFQVVGKQRTYFNADSTEVMKWNDDMLLFVIPGGRSDYFNKPENRERFGMSMLQTTYEADSSMVVIDSAMATAATDYDYAASAPEQAKVTPVKKKKATTGKSKAKSKTTLKGKKTNKKNYKRKPVRKVEVEEEAIDSAIVEVPEPENDYFKDERIKKAQVARWTGKMADSFFTEVSKTSVLDNKDFVNSIDQKAEATVWISGAEQLMSKFMPQYLKGINLLSGYGSSNAKLYFEDKSVRLSTSVTFSEEMGSVMKKINSRKLNPQFLKYVNEDKLIGYFAYAMDTKAYLQEYPKLVAKFYGSAYSEEVGMATDLFSLLLDEEAVSKVIKGDGLFIFNGLSQKEVSYKTFEYNEDDFTTNEVTKTKKETLPDFLFMFSSEDTRLINKLIAYGVKKQLVKSATGYYELAVPNSPMAIFFAIKNGIIFIGTNDVEMQQIAGNSYQAKVSATHKRALLNGNYSGFFSPKKLSGKLPAEGIANSGQLGKVNKTLSTLGDIYMRSFPIKGNTYSGEVSMDIPADQKNALKYLFAVIEDAQK